MLNDAFLSCGDISHENLEDKSFTLERIIDSRWLCGGDKAPDVTFPGFSRIRSD